MEDDFVRLFGISMAQWVVRLSDGATVYQDDGRPGLPAEPSAWVRLAHYVRKANLKIVSLEVRFRSVHLKPLPEAAEGYFFRRAVGAFSSGPTFYYYLLGYLKDGKVHVKRYSVPDLTHVGDEVRDPLNPEMVGESLI